MSTAQPMLRPTTEVASRTWSNTALWSKSLREARWLWLSCAALMFALHLVRAWITSLVPMSDFRGILSFVPAFVQNMFPVSLEQLATTAGRIATSYDDPIVLLICLVWTFARASDVVSGELGRGTLEMTLAQPISRTGYLLTHSAVTVLGAAMLALAAWVATLVAINILPFEDDVDPNRFLPAAFSLFALMYFLAGVTTLASSADRHRWRTIAIAGGFYAVESIVRIVSLLAPGWDGLSYVTFLSAFNPQAYVAQPDMLWQIYDVHAQGFWRLGGLGGYSVLIGIGTLAFLAGAIVFARRDLQAPL